MIVLLTLKSSFPLVNLAGKRPTKSSTNEKESYRGCDQKLGECSNIKKKKTATNLRKVKIIL